MAAQRSLQTVLFNPRRFLVPHISKKVTLNNAGPSTGRNITVSVQLPVNVSFVSGPSFCELHASSSQTFRFPHHLPIRQLSGPVSVSCKLSLLPPNAPVFFLLNLRAGSSLVSGSSVIVVSVPQQGQQSFGFVQLTYCSRFALSIDVQGPPFFSASGGGTVMANLRNLGPSDVSGNMTVTFFPPPGLLLAMLPSNQTICSLLTSNSVVFARCILAGLTAGNFAAFPFPVQVVSGQACNSAIACVNASSVIQPVSVG